MPNLTKVPPVPVQNKVDNFVWMEWFREIRDSLWRASCRGTLEVLDINTSTVLPTTPTAFKPQTIVSSEYFTYDTTTGEICITEGGCFTLSLSLNAHPSASNKRVYFYATIDTGNGHQIRRYSAREQELVNSQEAQITFVSSNYFEKNTKIILYIWADATVTLKTTDLPGTTAGTATVPAARLLWA